MAFVWPIVCAALQLVTLRTIDGALERFLGHLERRRAGPRERRAALFQRNLEWSARQCAAA